MGAWPRQMKMRRNWRRRKRRNGVQVKPVVGQQRGATFTKCRPLLRECKCGCESRHSIGIINGKRAVLCYTLHRMCSAIVITVSTSLLVSSHMSKQCQ